MPVSSQSNKTVAKTAKLALPRLSRGNQMTAQEYAYRCLRHALMTGAIAPGRPITIREIADAMELSPTPVREALRRLSSEHALTVLGNRRIIVPEMTVARFEELVLLRSALESYAAKRAIPYVNKVLIDELETIDARIDEAVANDDHTASVLLNQSFHKGIYRANPEQVVLPMIESLWLQLGPFLRIAAQYTKELYLVDRHAEIIDALRRRDALAVSLAIDADVRDGVSHLGHDTLDKILHSSTNGDSA